MITRTVKIAFNPHDSVTLRNLFEDPEARTLWLLWRGNHLVSDDFGNLCLFVAARIRGEKPETADELRKCFPTMHHYWTPSDVKAFSEENIGYFTGEKQVLYEVIAQEPQKCPTTDSK